MSRKRFLTLFSVSLICATLLIFWQTHLDGRQESRQEIAATGDPAVDIYLNLLTSRDPSQSIQSISDNWHSGSPTMLLEVIRFNRNGSTRSKLLRLLSQKTGQKFGDNFDAWYNWIWNQDYQPYPQYAQFKGQLYSLVDPRFSEYFEESDGATIRLDEIRWGGVRRDGIPPLKNPIMVKPDEANWMADSNVVFGVVINGDARCYPKRILAWHEMFKDTIGGQSVCGAY